MASVTAETRERASPMDVRRLLVQTGDDPVREMDDIDPDQIQWYIDSVAGLYIDEQLIGTGQSEDRLKTIEAYLAAHAISYSGIEEWRQAQLVRDSGGLQTDYAGAFEQEGLRATSLGQTAIQLDESNRLAAMAENRGDWWHYSIHE